MIVLALDSSADALAVAVLRDGEPLVEHTCRAARPRGENLLPTIDALLAELEMPLDAVNLIAVATGPGSFNGIRGGIATAQGLALALGVPAVGVPTLDALAYPQAGRAPVVCAVLPAGRGELYSACYAGTWTDWRRLGEYTVAPAAEVVAVAPAEALLCGRVPGEVAALAAGRGLAVAPAVAAFGRASFVGALGAMRVAVPAFDVAASLTPLYLRRPGITVPLTPNPSPSRGRGEPPRASKKSGTHGA